MHAETYLREAADICAAIDPEAIERMAAALSKVEGRVYVIGLGGSLANAIHMAADLRNLCDIDADAPSNISEMTAHANDYAWDNLFYGFLKHISSKDALFVLSVGGGTADVSKPINEALLNAIKRKAPIFGIVGPKGGYTAEWGNYVIKIPVTNPKHITPHTEAFQAVCWHMLVSHPLLQRSATKW